MKSLVQGLLPLSRGMDRLSLTIGSALRWFVLVTIFVSAGNAVVRKAFSISSNAALELQWYLFAAVFMLGAGYAFLLNVHVRIDFISAKLSARTKNWIDIIGIVVFLIPLCVLVGTTAWPLFVNAFVTNETSQNAGGLIRWPVMLLIPAGLALLGLQGISELVKRAAFLYGIAPDPLRQAAEHGDTAANAGEAK